MSRTQRHQKALDNNAPIVQTPTYLRELTYLAQTGKTELTPRQRRRLRHKENHMDARARRLESE